MSIIRKRPLAATRPPRPSTSPPSSSHSQPEHPKRRRKSRSSPSLPPTPGTVARFRRIVYNRAEQLFEIFGKTKRSRLTLDPGQIFDLITDPPVPLVPLLPMRPRAPTNHDTSLRSSTGGGYRRKLPMGTQQHKNDLKVRESLRLGLLADERSQTQGVARDQEAHDTLNAYRARVNLLREDFEPSAPFQLVRSSSRGSSILRSRASERSLDLILHNAKLTRSAKPELSESLIAFERLQLDQREREEAEQVLLSRVDEPPRRKFPKKLSQANQSIVEQTLKSPSFESTLPGAQVQSKDIKKLKGLSWLNDEVITFYSVLINQRSNRVELEGIEQGGRTYLRTWCFTSFFYAKFSSTGHVGVKRWTKKVDIFAKDVVIIPINLGNSHWVCAAINIRLKRFEYYDSLGTAKEGVYKRLRSYLIAEHLEKKKSVLDLGDWTNYWDVDVPQQENGCDCGVFTCQFMESLSRSSEGFDFTQEQMPYFRSKMILEITQQELIEEPLIV